MNEIKRLISETKAYACLECGKCAAVCPVSRYDPAFSPRMLVYEAVQGDVAKVLESGQLWSCLACGACQNICDSGVNYTEFIKGLRKEAHLLGMSGTPSHAGGLQSLMRMMAGGEFKQERLDWITKGLEVADTSDTLYFVGCQPYFDVFFSNLRVKTLTIAKGSVALLNRLGIVPAVSPNERCCGHDLLWSGEIDRFVELAKNNVEEIRKTGANRVVTSCPECYRTLKYDYPQFLGNVGFEVVHLSQLVAEPASSGRLKFRRVNRKITYHDPCRLGRLSGVYDEPRAILSAIPGLDLIEMSHSRGTSLCCGTQCWMNCGDVNKQAQVELLKEAKATGADVLVTACPKCRIHLKCAMQDEGIGRDLRIEIRDLAEVAAGALAKDD